MNKVYTLHDAVAKFVESGDCISFGGFTTNRKPYAAAVSYTHLDQRYACTVVRHYSGKGYGVRKLQDELYRRGVPREMWEQALEEAQDPTNAIEAFVAKKLAGKEVDRRELKRVSDALLRRGYQWQEIRPVLDRYSRDDLD